ncbi:hypothetical protein ACP70R_041362 [Stipagrostis hirtigluma subsp. patula]
MGDNINGGQPQQPQEGIITRWVTWTRSVGGSLNNDRGSALTVATLFVGMAFQAAINPPHWIPKTQDWFDALHGSRSSSSSVTEEQATKALLYLIFNSVTFSMALTLVLLLTIPQQRPDGASLPIGIITVLLTIFVTGNFLVGVGDDTRVIGVTLGVVVFVAAFAIAIYYVAPRLVPQGNNQNAAVVVPDDVPERFRDLIAQAAQRFNVAAPPHPA